MTPFFGQIKILPFSWAPKGYSLCDGTTMPIQQNAALYSLLGIQFGGNGTVNFCLPDLRGRTPLHPTYPDHSINQGEFGGFETVTLTDDTMPRHTHIFKADRSMGNYFAAEDFADADAHKVFAQPVLYGSTTTQDIYGMVESQTNLTSLAPGTSSMVGGGRAHNNLQPSLVVTYVIALEGMYPSRS